MIFPPFIYEPQQSIDVLKHTEEYLNSSPEMKNKIEKLSWIYHSIGRSIPQTTENFWSGHYFPYSESWDELQISFNLACFGFYKQAFMSLRSALEVGTLSIYFNINDEGHRTVKDWLSSADSPDGITPRSNKIWKILNSNKNIKIYNDQFGLREEYESFGYLHNYIHTKGYKFSNRFGIAKSNMQTFEENIFCQWVESFEKIIDFLVQLHILKYPISILEYNWFSKVGIDNPYPVLEISDIRQIKELLPNSKIKALIQIAEQDESTQGLFNMILNLPDLTEEDIDLQLKKHHQFSIEHGEGFIEWEKNQKINLERYSKEERRKFISLIEELRVWANENGYMESKLDRTNKEF